MMTYALGSPNHGTNPFPLPWQGRGKPKRGENIIAGSDTIVPVYPTGDASGIFFSPWVQSQCLHFMGSLARFKALFIP